MIGQSVTLGFLLAKYDSHCLGYLLVFFLHESKPMKALSFFTLYKDILSLLVMLPYLGQD